MTRGLAHWDDVEAARREAGHIGGSWQNLGSATGSVRRGSVVSRPAGTRVAHAFRAGGSGLVLLAYGTREPNDIAYYPRSNKVFLRGVGLIARLEPLGYWDGED